MRSKLFLVAENQSRYGREQGELGELGELSPLPNKASFYFLL
jgi:hypothetical protein